MIFPYEVVQSLTEVFGKQKCTFSRNKLHHQSGERLSGDSFCSRQIIIKVNTLNVIAHKAEH